ncbi:OstA-like protein [Fodinibius salinus]|uniref:OstA-like protein n=1 Tax=Fodinibius salinus TaxID=860790 RepID=A0A5D3YM00_9BACT|nr:OstA-like protein [Fodinibius salinus]TYP94920.1 OstA-like protein [Fodinibius salinus]
MDLRYSHSKIKNTLQTIPVWTLVLVIPILLISLLPQSSQAQRKVTILKADSIRGGNFQGQRIQKIIGNVHLQGQNMEMYCDSAYQFTNKSKIRAFGNIQINTESEKIWADSLTYFTDVDFSELRGRVIIEADSTTLFGNSVDYRFSTRIAHFIDKIRLEDQRGTLLADSGYYYRRADSAKFRGHVQIADSLQYLEGDSLFSNRDTKYYELYGKVYGNDQKNESMIQGDYLESDSTGRKLLEGNAWLQNFESDTTDTTQADTTHIQANIIRSIKHQSQTDTSTTVRGFENVRIWSSSFSAVGDTTTYTDSTNTFEIWSNAKSWHEQVQLTGPYILAKIKNGDIDSLKSYPRPFSVQQDTSLNRLNQITGDTLHANFNEGTLRQIYVFGNAKLLRYTKNKKGQPDGAIDLTAPDIRIFFKNGQLKKMNAIGTVDGSYLPESEQTANRRLNGFSWNPDLRPERPKKKMKRRFPPISDDIFFPLPQRYIEHLKEEHPESKWLPISTSKSIQKSN